MVYNHNIKKHYTFFAANVTQTNALQPNQIHQRSVVKKTDLLDESDAAIEWLVFGIKSFRKTQKFISEITLVPAINVILLAGQLNMTTNDSETILTIDDRWKFSLNEEEARLLLHLKLNFDSIFNRYLKNTNTFKATTEEMDIINVFGHVLMLEDNVEKRLKIERANAMNSNL